MSSCYLPLTSEDGTSSAADNACCQTGENFLYYFKGARLRLSPARGRGRAKGSRAGDGCCQQGMRAEVQE